jgi:hypothetical protein
MQPLPARTRTRPGRVRSSERSAGGKKDKNLHSCGCRFSPHFSSSQRLSSPFRLPDSAEAAAGQTGSNRPADTGGTSRAFLLKDAKLPVCWVYESRLAVAIQASLVLAFLGINASEVSTHRCVFSHHYLGMHVAVVAVIFSGRAG